MNGDGTRFVIGKSQGEAETRALSLVTDWRSREE